MVSIQQPMSFHEAFQLVWPSLPVVPYPVFQTSHLMLCTRLSLHATPNLPTCSLTGMPYEHFAPSPRSWNQVTVSATMAPRQIKKPWLARRDWTCEAYTFWVAKRAQFSRAGILMSQSVKCQCCNGTMDKFFPYSSLYPITWMVQRPENSSSL